MKAKLEQLNAATLAYEFGRQWAILNPGKAMPGAKVSDRLVDLLVPFQRSIPGAVRERFKVAMQNGWALQDATQGFDHPRAVRRLAAVGKALAEDRPAKPLPTKETLDVIGKLRAHGVKVNTDRDGRPTKNKITPSTAIGLTG